MFFKTTVYERDCAMLPLIVMAEGAMDFTKEGELIDSQWVVPLV